MALFMSILQLLAGVGVFMAGMKFMSDGLQQSAGKGMRQMFNRLSDKKLAGYGIGAGVTSLIQSSAATSVMAMGLVNAGIMQLTQATAIVLGAKLGTTITGVIVALSAFGSGGFSLNVFFAAVSLVGVAMMLFSKKERVNRIGIILTGFGLIFVGLIFMSSAMGTELIKNFFVNLFSTIKNPILLMLISLLFTALIQSSSAATGIYITLMGVGTMTTYQAFFLVIGANIGTCITAVLAAIGASTNSKRVAFLHVVTSVFGAIVFCILLAICGNQIAKFMDGIIDIPGWRIAIFNVVFNLSYTLLLLPFVGQLAKLSTVLIKDNTKEKHSAIKFIDDRLLKTPTIAITQVQREVLHMASLAKENLAIAMEALINCDISKNDLLEGNEDDINVLNKEIASYLIKISSLNISSADEKLLGTLHHVINDIERIGDHAENFMELAGGLLQDNAEFSDEAIDELKNMYAKVDEMFGLGLNVVETRNKAGLKTIAQLEDEVDTLKKVYGDHHILRLHAQKCSVEGGTYFYDVITELERIADHITNIAFSVDSPTGTQTAV
ncbi:MAG: Na/Pi cotransporter family protein [Clostridiales bacterium]|nr:Na/Pi cotransporter family protein [Clostridiales bacterium]